MSFTNSIGKHCDTRYILVGLTIFLISFAFFGIPMVYAIEIFTKDDMPFRVLPDDWIGKWWSWWISVPGNEDGSIQDLKQDGCIMNNASSMVMLMETAVGGDYHQICQISSGQGIMVPLWTGWCDSGVLAQRQYSYAQLTKCARETADLGIVKSSLKVDGNTIANLAETSQDIGSGDIKYTKDRFDNVTEIYSNFTRGFDLTIPEDTHFPDQQIGTWRAGAHGWFVLLKPLPLGTHELSYVTSVNENVKSPEALGLSNVKQPPTEISYTLHVK